MSEKLTMGWREWISLPDFHIPAIKAKVDTGARTSALHAVDIEPFVRDDAEWVSFIVQPVQRAHMPGIGCEALVIDKRNIRDSGGHLEARYVVAARLQFAGREKLIEITLTPRHDMRFRMLLGRTALRQDIIVDPGVSYKLGRINIREIYP